ncbi:MAG: hypothetical protein VX615_01870 [Planctomycetota bacterium]|nr:hypothetical protein [Planctomycetota bacterium]
MDKQPASKRLWRLSAMGFTFISMVIAGGIIGLGIHWGCGLVFDDFSLGSKGFIVTGAVCGIVVGMVDFIRDAMRAVKDDS